MSIYYTNEDAKYKLNIDFKNNNCMCNTIVGDDGKEKLLHNEVAFNYEIINGEIHVINGTHIGTEDFDFSEKDGDDCNYYVEYYHPGLLNQLKKEIENMRDTRVVCPNCGTSFELPNHEHACSGVAIGKDSGLGTVYLTPEKESKKMNKAEQRMETLKNAGIDTSKFMVLTGANGEGFLFNTDSGIPTPVMDDDYEKLITSVKQSGYVFNRNVDARWITGQMFHALNSSGGYERWLDSKGYLYQLKFIRDEWGRLAKKEKDGDMETLKSRGQFFSIENVIAILREHLIVTRDYLGTLKEKKCKKVPYIRIPGFRNGNDRMGDVFIDDIDKKCIAPIRDVINILQRTSSFKSAYAIMRNYLYGYNYIEVPNNTKQIKKFRDCYKALGAYETSDNLIKFHNCNVYGCTTEGSLRELRTVTAEAMRRHEYYRIFGFMRELIRVNNFTPDWR